MKRAYVWHYSIAVLFDVQFLFYWSLSIVDSMMVSLFFYLPQLLYDFINFNCELHNAISLTSAFTVHSFFKPQTAVSIVFRVCTFLLFSTLLLLFLYWAYLFVWEYSICLTHTHSLSDGWSNEYSGCQSLVVTLVNTVVDLPLEVPEFSWSGDLVPE